MLVMGWVMAVMAVFGCCGILFSEGVGLRERESAWKQQMTVNEGVFRKSLATGEEALAETNGKIAELKRKLGALRQVRDTQAKRTAALVPKIVSLEKKLAATQARVQAGSESAAAAAAELAALKERQAALAQEVAPLRQAAQTLLPRSVSDAEAGPGFNPIPPP